MEDIFKIPEENSASDDSLRRASDLIEEIRADIDFELDDAVTEIVRNLPDEYFARTDRENQVAHLKGLIASRICQLNGELFLPASDGSQIAVLGRRSYRGQLANILSELPGKKTRLVGANIYTAKSHDFILDVFEFESDQQPAASSFSAEVIERLSQSTQSSDAEVSDFLSRIRTTRAKAPDLHKLERLFLAQQNISESNPFFVESVESEDGQLNLIVAVHGQDERLSFLQVTESLSQQSLDIEQAELVVVRHEKAANEPENARTDKSILMNFLLSNEEQLSFDVTKWATSLNKG